MEPSAQLSLEQQLAQLKQSYANDVNSFEKTLEAFRGLRFSEQYAKLKKWIDIYKIHFEDDVFNTNRNRSINEVRDSFKKFQGEIKQKTQEIHSTVKLYWQKIEEIETDKLIPHTYPTFKRKVLEKLPSQESHNDYNSIQRKIVELDDSQRDDKSKYDELVSAIRLQKLSRDNALREEKKSSSFGGVVGTLFSKDQHHKVYGELLKSTYYFSLEHKKFEEKHERYLDYMKLIDNFRLNKDNTKENSGLASYSSDLDWLKNQGKEINRLYLNAMNSNLQEEGAEASIQKKVAGFYAERRKRFKKYLNAIHDYKRVNKNKDYCCGEVSFNAYCNIVLHTLSTYNSHNSIRILSISKVKIAMQELQKKPDDQLSSGGEKIHQLTECIKKQKGEYSPNCVTSYL